MAIPGSYTYPAPPGSPPSSPPGGGGGGGAPPSTTGGWWQTLLGLLGGDLDRFPGLKERLLAYQAAHTNQSGMGAPADKTGWWGGPAEYDKIMSWLPTSGTPRTRPAPVRPVLNTDAGPPPLPAAGTPYVWPGPVVGTGAGKGFNPVDPVNPTPLSGAVQYGMGTGSVAGSSGASRPSSVGSLPSVAAASAPTSWLSSILNNWR